MLFIDSHVIHTSHQTNNTQYFTIYTIIFVLD